MLILPWPNRHQIQVKLSSNILGEGVVKLTNDIALIMDYAGKHISVQTL